MSYGKYAIATIGGKAVPVEIVRRNIAIVRPLDGHLGDGREAEVEVDYEHIVICADQKEAETIADRRNNATTTA